MKRFVWFTLLTVGACGVVVEEPGLRMVFAQAAGDLASPINREKIREPIQPKSTVSPYPRSPLRMSTVKSDVDQWDSERLGWGIAAMEIPVSFDNVHYYGDWIYPNHDDAEFDSPFREREMIFETAYETDALQVISNNGALESVFGQWSDLGTSQTQ